MAELRAKPRSLLFGGLLAYRLQLPKNYAKAIHLNFSLNVSKPGIILLPPPPCPLPLGHLQCLKTFFGCHDGDGVWRDGGYYWHVVGRGQGLW